jgi:hypothetical protein
VEQRALRHHPAVPRAPCSGNGDHGGAIVEAISGGRVAAGEAGPLLAGFSAYGGSQRAVVELLAEAAGAWPLMESVPSLLAGPGSTAEVADIGAGPQAQGDRALAAADRAPRRVTLSHYDPARDYQAGLQIATRPAPAIARRRSSCPPRSRRARPSSSPRPRSPAPTTNASGGR